MDAQELKRLKEALEMLRRGASADMKVFPITSYDTLKAHIDGLAERAVSPAESVQDAARQAPDLGHQTTELRAAAINMVRERGLLSTHVNGEILTRNEVADTLAALLAQPFQQEGGKEDRRHHEEPDGPNHPGHHDGHTCEAMGQMLADFGSQRTTPEAVVARMNAKRAASATDAVPEVVRQTKAAISRAIILLRDGCGDRNDANEALSRLDDLAALATPAQATPEGEDDLANNWRRLALQFDGHRMQAIWHLKAMLQDPAAHKPVVEQFLSAGPLSGEEVLAQRIAALAASQQAAEPVALLDAIRDGVPLVEPVYVEKAMMAQRQAKVVLDSGVGPRAAVHLVNIGVTGWTHTKETAEAYADGFNLGAKWLRSSILSYAAGLYRAAPPQQVEVKTWQQRAEGSGEEALTADQCMKLAEAEIKDLRAALAQKGGA